MEAHCRKMASKQKGDPSHRCRKEPSSPSPWRLARQCRALQAARQGQGQVEVKGKVPGTKTALKVKAGTQVIERAWPPESSAAVVVPVQAAPIVEVFKSCFQLCCVCSFFAEEFMWRPLHSCWRFHSLVYCRLFDATRHQDLLRTAILESKGFNMRELFNIEAMSPVNP